MLLTGIPKLSFKDNRAFAVVDAQGEAARVYQPSSELGFYYNDTRYLAVWETTYNGQSAVPLSQETRFSGTMAVLSMTNRDFPTLDGAGRIPRDTFLLRRVLCFQRDTLFEILEIKNFANVPHGLQIEQWAGGKFDDVFEVRGYPREKRGRMLQPEEREDERGGVSTTLRYEGLDNKVRKTHIRRYFPVEKIRLSPALAGYFTKVEVPAKGVVLLRSIVSFDEPPSGLFSDHSFGELSVPDMMKLASGSREKQALSPLKFESDNAIVNRSIQNAQTDIYMLLTREGDNVYPYAGIPWFSAPFGRDGLITAYQLLPWSSDLARGVLDYAFACLGTKVDAFTDEEPGKVFHEMRRGEMSATKELPFIPYYGSVDSTPLSLILLHEYVRWTMDLENLRKWWPSALRALEWIENRVRPDVAGFLSYASRSPTGLVNQGWKDSHDSVMHADGTLAHAPIRLCEVQAYAFRAKMAMSRLARLMGDEGLSSKLRLQALSLKNRFLEKFWNPYGGFVHLALDGDMKPCAVRSSNMGHCLWGQILNPDHASGVVKHLMSDAMFNGYGIRTLADTEVAYNPLSYHNGSIWPHDNSLIMEGMRNYGFVNELETLSQGLIEVLESSEDFRLPELFCGFRRRGSAPPIPYEVACKPQAWAAGSIFLMLRAMLGFSMETDQSYAVFNSPILTSKMETLEVKGIRGRDWEMDLRFRRARSGGTSLEVLRKDGNVRVLTVK